MAFSKKFASTGMAMFVVVVMATTSLTVAQLIPSCASKLTQCAVFISNATSKPDTSCCNSIKDVVANDLSCLCTLYTMPGLLASFNISVADALRVSRDCNVNIDLSTCNSTTSPSPMPPPVQQIMSCASKLTQCAVFISNATSKPDTSCCNSIKDAVANDLSCLCTLYTTPGLLASFNINVADALRVSRDCNVNTDLSTCNSTTSPSPVSPPALQILSCALELTQCAIFISNTTSKPDTLCCNSIKDVVANDLFCLCTLYTTPGLLASFNINVTDALRVSRDCNVNTDLSTCNTPQIPSCASKLTQCAVYISNATSKPDTSCCNSIKDAVANDLSCLCTIYTTPGLLASFNINVADALKVSRDCNVNTDLSTCNSTTSPTPMWPHGSN